MTSPQEKIADSLEALEALRRKGVVAVHSSDLSRTDRERLREAGFLQEVMKGWYFPTRPDERQGESTAWYASFWDFCAAYLERRFGDQWSLSPEQSLFLHAGQRTVPRQLLIRAPRGRNKPTALPHNTELLAICTAWQLRDMGGQPIVNTHDDPDYDRACVARLGELDDKVEPLVHDLADLLARFGDYRHRLRAARGRVEAGDTDWFTSPGVDSYHTVWFELHEHLLATLGLERTDERNDP